MVSAKSCASASPPLNQDYKNDELGTTAFPPQIGGRQ